MAVSALMCTDFMNHEMTSLAFPETGVVLFTGDNGAGKSAIGEMILWCLYGGSIRARSDWSPVNPGTVVEMVVDGENYCREALKSGTRFLINEEGYSTSANNKEVIQRYGTHRLFLTTHVFHRALMVKFSMSTDSERKNLIEYLLGVDTFDKALKSVKEERRTLRSEHDHLLRTYHNKSVELARLEGRLLGLKPPDKPTKPDKLGAAQLWLKSCEVPEEAGEHPKDDAIYSVQHKVARQAAVVENLRKTIEEFKRLYKEGKCYTCLQPTKKAMESRIPGLESDLKTQEKELQDLKAAMRKAREDHDEAVKAWKERRAVFQEYLSVEATYKATVSLWEQSRRDYRRRLKKLEKRRNRLLLELRFKKLKVDKYHKELMELRCSLSRLDDLIQIYGPRGARMTLLSDAFSVLSGVATEVAQRLYNKNIGVEVRPDDKFETISLLISLEDGKEISYRGLSEGERSLVDFSILKALSSIPRRTGSLSLPYIYDDVCDALKHDNQERLAGFLLEEARDNQVFVFSHDDSIADLFPGATHFVVEDGTVERR